jgi:hypothetical protein
MFEDERFGAALRDAATEARKLAIPRDELPTRKWRKTPKYDVVQYFLRHRLGTPRVRVGAKHTEDLCESKGR